MISTWSKLNEAANRQGAGLWLLIDPEKTDVAEAARTAGLASTHGCDALLVGASTGSSEQFSAVARAVFHAADCPVLLFPNGAAQVVPHADAILFLSLLSGRNPRYLIDEQVKGAPLVRQHGLEAIPTAYLLIESGHQSSVEQVSGTRPLARCEPELASAHALAARYLGMSLLYLEAGSGAPEPVPGELVSQCANAGMPVAVGGGIRTPRVVADLTQAGARFVVVGNHFETQPDWTLFDELAAATHHKEALRVG
jgi:phosphoglycerol geranylgeranyltransferase